MSENDKKKYNEDSKDVPENKTISESDTERLVELVDRNAEIIRKFKNADEVYN